MSNKQTWKKVPQTSLASLYTSSPLTGNAHMATIHFKKGLPLGDCPIKSVCTSKPFLSVLCQHLCLIFQCGTNYLQSMLVLSEPFEGWTLMVKCCSLFQTFLHLKTIDASEVRGCLRMLCRNDAPIFRRTTNNSPLPAPILVTITITTRTKPTRVLLITPAGFGDED